jgi:hypothetical protein
MRTRYKVIIGVAVAILLIIVGIGIVGYFIGQLTPTVQITGENLEIEYTSIFGGYFGPSSQSLGYATNGPSGGTFSFTFTLTSNAILLTHSINQITVGTPGFTLLSISPSLPYSVSPGGSVTITLVIRAPNTNYIGPLNIVLVTS